MRKCNVCNRRKPNWFFKTPQKKTCRQCEFSWWRWFLRSLIKQRKLTINERIGNRLGYMGTMLL